MRGNVQSDYMSRLLLDYVTLTVAFLLTRIFIAFKGDVFLTKVHLLLLVISLFIWHLTGKVHHLYDDFKSRSFAYEFVAILKTTLLHLISITFVLFYLFNNYPYPRTFSLLYSAIIFLLVPLEKFFYKQVIILPSALKHDKRNVLIVGAGDLGMSFYKTVISMKQYGYKLAGFVDDTKKPHLNGEYLGKIEDLSRIFETEDVEDVVVALPNTAVQKIEEVIEVSERNAKRVRIIPDYYRFSSGNFKIGNFGSFPIITVRSTPLDEVEKQAFKRTFDVIFSTVLLFTCFIWLFPLIALIIKTTSAGPIFFKQARWGLNNKKITCYKFRSMSIDDCKDINHDGKYLQAKKDDPRVTRIGRFLRKTNLDELPQFINVLIGDMSIVGPRPHPIPLNLESKDTVQNYMLRHMVKPGITGWAQVNGARGETTLPGQMQKRVNFDLWYIENWTFWLDCQIIFQTIMNMVKGDKHAY